MSNYDKQYRTEDALFGVPYPEFEDFVRKYGLRGGRALDIGCGQGRDALMLARYGYDVTGIDSSQVGIEQMLDQAEINKLPVIGLVADFYEYEPDGTFDAIVLDSILHFEKADKDKELQLLDTLSNCLNENGYFFIFVHKSVKKEKMLHQWLAGVKTMFTLIQEGYIDTVYEEKSSGFRTEFQMAKFILQRNGRKST